MKLVATAALLGLAVGVAQAAADEVSEVIEGALEAYDAGDVDVAIEELQYAMKLLGELKAVALAAFLPEAQPGWTRSEDDTGGSAAFMGMLGGGTTASATYSRGVEAFTISIVADSPMVSGIAAMFSGVATAGAGSSFRIQRQQFAESDGEIQGIVGDDILVTAEGEAPVEAIKVHLEAMDMRALADF